MSKMMTFSFERVEECWEKEIMQVTRMFYFSNNIFTSSLSRGLKSEEDHLLICRYQRRGQQLYSPSIPKNSLCLTLQDFVNLKITQLLMGWSITEAECVLLSNVS